MRQPCYVCGLHGLRTWAGEPAIVGSPVDSRGLHSLRMWDEKYS